MWTAQVTSSFHDSILTCVLIVANHQPANIAAQNLTDKSKSSEHLAVVTVAKISFLFPDPCKRGTVCIKILY